MAIQYKVYFRLWGDSWTYLGNTYETFHIISNELRAALNDFSTYEWRVDTRDDETGLTTTGDTWTFVSDRSDSFTKFDRHTDYDGDKVWQPGTGWVDINDFGYTGGGRHKEQLVVVGHKSIYFGAI